MTDQQTLSPAEVSRRITVGMGMVYDLFNELVPFLRTLRRGLEESDLDVDPIVPKLGRLPLGPPRERQVANNFLTTDMGFMMELGASSSEEGDEEEDEGEEEDEAESEGPWRPRTHQVTPESQFLAVRIHLYDPTQASSGDFTPQVIAGVVGDIVRVPAKKNANKKPVDNPVVRRPALLKLTKQLHGGLKANQSVEARRVHGGRLVAKVLAVTSRPLASFDSEAKVNEFVDELVTMAGEAGT